MPLDGNARWPSEIKPAHPERRKSRSNWHGGRDSFRENLICVITEEKIEQTVSRAEKSFHDCWDKLFAMKDAESLFSFQPALLTALYQIEAIYHEVCKEGRRTP
jgi:hypothetical protein